MSMIFSDIDGTIYGTEKKVHKDMFQNIKEAKKASVMFNIATGNGMWPKIIDLGKSLGAKYLINSNGAGIYDLVEEKSIYTNMISQKDAQKVLGIANKYELGSDWWDENKIYFNQYASEELMQVVINAVSEDENNAQISNEILGDIFKIELYDKNYKMIEKARQEIIALGLEVAHIKPEHLEITKSGVSKAHAIEILCANHSVDPSKVMTIGDSANDITMLELTEYSYAMANSPQNIKEVAKFHTAAYNQNGVGMAIIDFLHRTQKDC